MTTLADEGQEFFDWQGIKIFQHETVHKVGTDAVLLASWTAGLVKDVWDMRKLIADSVQLNIFEPEDKAIWDEAYDKYLKITK